ncbi:MAG TPA: neutral zinc metallopeptidase [Candidatus Limnocylindrales bacterium]|nr:neutral zinc metallopeptidase [Candidatus Limnocylindrales bacterium]
MSINENADLDPSQVEDLRGVSGGAAAGAGCLTALMPTFRRSPKLGCAAVLLAVLCLGGFVCLNTTNIGENIGVGGAGGGGPVANEPEGNPDLQEACSTANPDRFQRTDCRNLAYINSIQAYWRQAMPQYFGQPYQKATTRLFSGGVQTACGAATAGTGPFYCPADKHVYIDISFYDELAHRYGAPGQFAQAYVLAHEYGHHVQTLLGTEADARRAQQRDPANANRYSVALELQADCYAGAWANAAGRTTDATGQPLFTSVTQQDIDQALQAAAAVGDDTIQKKTTGQINESGFTHGSAEQRQQWFGKGYQTGDPRQCNTFA